MRKITLLTTTFVILATLVAEASGHYKRPGQADNAAGQWYFTGVTYKDRPLTKANQKDPVNVFFYGAGDSSPYTRARIEQHLRDDWDTSRVGGRPWSTDDQIIGVCKDKQYVGWPGYPGMDSDRTDWLGSTSAKVFVPGLPSGQYKTGCFAQHHMRFWDDQEHTRLTPAGTHVQDDWVVAGFHHERSVSKVDPFKVTCCAGHKIDRDWDRVRVEFTKGLATHCTVRRWKYQPQADGMFQGFENSGLVARVSLRHRSQGCSGA